MMISNGGGVNNITIKWYGLNTALTEYLNESCNDV